MKKVEICLGKWGDAEEVWTALSAEFEAGTRIDTLKGLEEFLRRRGDLYLRIRYADDLYGTAKTCFEEVLGLFERLRSEGGAAHFDYTLLPREAVELDFTGCRYVGELYRELRVKMDWRSDYGENLDALWDILRGMPYRGDDFIILRPRTYANIPHGHHAPFTEYVDKICSVFQEAAKAGCLTVQIRYVDPKEDGDPPSGVSAL